MSNIAEKVQKLLRTAERFAQDGNQEAADSYNAKAQRLVLENAIDEADILAAGKEKIESIVEKPFRFNGPYAKAWTHAAFAVASVLGMNGFAVTHSQSARSLVVIGFESDVKTFELLWASMQLQETNAVWNDWKQYKQDNFYFGSPDYSIQKQYKNAHILAFGSRVSARIKALKREVTQEKVEAGSSTALVLVDRKSQVDRYYEDNHGGGRKGRKFSRLNGSGYAAGERAEREIAQTSAKRRPELAGQRLWCKMEIENGQLKQAGFTLNWPLKRVTCIYCLKYWESHKKEAIYEHMFECEGVNEQEKG